MTRFRGTLISMILLVFFGLWGASCTKNQDGDVIQPSDAGGIDPNAPALPSDQGGKTPDIDTPAAEQAPTVEDDQPVGELTNDPFGKKAGAAKRKQGRGEDLGSPRSTATEPVNVAPENNAVEVDRRDLGYSPKTKTDGAPKVEEEGHTKSMEGQKTKSKKGGKKSKAQQDDDSEDIIKPAKKSAHPGLPKYLGIPKKNQKKGKKSKGRRGSSTGNAADDLPNAPSNEGEVPSPDDNGFDGEAK